MKDKPIPQKLKSLVRDAIKRHARNIGVSEYLVSINWMFEDKKKEIDDLTTLAEIHVNRRYLKATISIYPSVIDEWKKHGNDSIEQTIAHEISHIATQHMYHMATTIYKDDGEMCDAWETLTERISRMSFNMEKLK